MKKLKTIVHGDLRVVVEVTASDDVTHHCLDLAATCGETTRRSRLTQHPNPDRAIEHLESDVDKLAERLAREAAGHERARLLKKAYLEGE